MNLYRNLNSDDVRAVRAGGNIPTRGNMQPGARTDNPYVHVADAKVPSQFVSATMSRNVIQRYGHQNQDYSQPFVQLNAHELRSNLSFVNSPSAPDAHLLSPSNAPRTPVMRNGNPISPLQPRKDAAASKEVLHRGEIPLKAVVGGVFWREQTQYSGIPLPGAGFSPHLQ
jgi:hypothetical protein